MQLTHTVEEYTYVFLDAAEADECGVMQGFMNAVPCCSVCSVAKGRKHPDEFVPPV